MRNLTPFLIAGLSTTLGACAPEPETGIDRTVLSGTVQITPHLTIEDESVVGSNDAIVDNVDTDKVVEIAHDLGLLGHRYSLVDGTCHTFSAERDVHQQGTLTTTHSSLSFRAPSQWDSLGQMPRSPIPKILPPKKWFGN